MGIDENSRIAALAPLFHVTGFVLHFAVTIAAGCSMALCHRFDPLVALAMVRDYRPTSTVTAITAFSALAREEAVRREDLACFATVFSGGAPIAPALRDRLRERLGMKISRAA